MKSFKYALGIVGGLCFLFALMPNTFFNFEGLNDAQYGEALTEALQVDRASLFSADAFRSLAFILLSAVGIWLYLNKTIKKTPLILLIGVLILSDMWVVNKRYLNDMKTSRRKEKYYNLLHLHQQIAKFYKTPIQIIGFIIRLSALSMMSTSYFHKSIGELSRSKA